jgi:hypothetical protein
MGGGGNEKRRKIPSNSIKWCTLKVTERKGGTMYTMYLKNISTKM